MSEQPTTAEGRALLDHFDGPHPDTHRHDSIVEEHDQHRNAILAIEAEARHDCQEELALLADSLDEARRETAEARQQDGSGRLEPYR